MGHGPEGSLRSTIALFEMDRPSDPWKFEKLWEEEAVDAGRMTMKGLPGFRRAKADPETIDRLTPPYEEAMAWWRRFIDEEGELAEAIRQDAFLGITAHLPVTSTSTYE